MSQSESIWAKIQLRSPPEKFYGFFKNHVGELVNLFPELYNSIQLVETDSLSVGTVLRFKFHLGNQVVTEKYAFRVADDVKKCLIYEAVEGDLLRHYKAFSVKIEVVNNGGLNKVAGSGGSFAKWTVEFDKANPNVPSPEKYMELFVKISKGLDAYFSKN